MCTRLRTRLLEYDKLFTLPLKILFLLTWKFAENKIICNHKKLLCVSYKIIVQLTLSGIKWQYLTPYKTKCYLPGIPPTKSHNSEANNGVPSTHIMDDDERHQVKLRTAYQALCRCVRGRQAQGTAHVEAHR